MPGHAASQPAGQEHAQSDVLQTVPTAHVPPQSDGHWQLHAAVLHTVVVPLHAPPQFASQSHAHVVVLHTVPAPQAPPQSGAHSHAQVAVLQT